MGYVRQQLCFEDNGKDFANDRREDGTTKLPWACCVGGWLRLWFLLHGGNSKVPEQLEVKGYAFGREQ